MEEEQKKMVMGAIGVGLVIAVIYYFFVKEDTPVMQRNAPNKPSSTPSRTPSSTPSTVYVPVYSGSGSAYTAGGSTSNFISYGVSSGNTVALQKHLMNIYKISLPSFGADGFLGAETTDALRKNFPTIAKNVAARRGMLKDEYDIIMASKPSSSSSSSSSSSTSTTTCNRIRQGDMAYIACKTSTPSAGRTWVVAGLKEWADAIQANKSEFYCNQCWSKGTYSTKTGMRTS